MIAQIPLAVSDEDIVRVGERNPGWRVERIAGEMIMTPPSGFKSDVRAACAVGILLAWAKMRGGVVSASQGGSKPVNGDLVAPDAAWVDPSRWASLTEEQQEGFLPFAPDIVVEILSKSDYLERMTQKCARWHEAGAGYVVLVDPYRKSIATWGTRNDGDAPDFSPVLDI